MCCREVLPAQTNATSCIRKASRSLTGSSFQLQLLPQQPRGENHHMKGCTTQHLAALFSSVMWSCTSQCMSSSSHYSDSTKDLVVPSLYFPWLICLLLCLSSISRAITCSSKFNYNHTFGAKRLTPNQNQTMRVTITKKKAQSLILSHCTQISFALTTPPQASPFKTP